MRPILFISLLLLLAQHAVSQKSDTINITPKQLNTSVLREGVHRYLVYFKMGKNGTRTQTQFWTRKIERSQGENVNLITITQEWEYNDTVVHTVKSVCEAASLTPLSHEFWWKQRGAATIDIKKGTILFNGSMLTAADTLRQRKNAYSAFMSAQHKYFLNWHMDLEVFPTLPYKPGAIFLIPFYDPGTSTPLQSVAYKVTGSAQLNGYDDQKIDCWIMEHEEKGNKEMYWISKKTKEVLKLEQEINGTLYRIKLKLGFSL